MIYRVRLSGRAIDDLIGIRNWIAAAAGAETAEGYIDRITTKFQALESFPLRGTPRDDLVPGLRTITFERRVKIGYRVIDDEVLIERIVSTARDLSALF